LASTRRPTRRSLALVVSTICALVALFGLTANAGAITRSGGTGTDPWIASELPDYSPGDTVNLIGGSWQPGEAVHIVVNDDAGQTWSRAVDVTADDNGDIADSFTLPNWFVATYSVTATGASSGSATSSFTDGNVRARVAGGPTTANIGWAKFTGNTTCSGSPNSTGSGSVGTTMTGLGIPSGVDPGQSALLTAPTLSGFTFSNWSGAASSSTATVCVPGSNANQIDLVATYAPGINTTTAAQSKTATFGDASVTLTATVTPASGPAVNTGTVTFIVNGTSVTSGTVSAGSASASLSLAGVQAGSYAIAATYDAGSGFNGSTNSGQTPAPTLTVGKAASTTTVGCAAGPFVYDGSAKTPCSATVTGAGGLSQSLSVSYSNNLNAGTATASASYPGDANHNASSDSKTFAIGKADSTTTVTCAAGPFVYNGSAHTPCSASVTGAGGLNQSLSVSYSNNVNAGSATASASYAGDANHKASSDSKTFAIGKADSTTTVTCAAGPFVYDGSAKTPCSATLTGAGGLNQLLSVSYSDHVHAGTATASASYPGDANHEGSNDSQSFTIDKRTVTASIVAADKTYDGTDDATIDSCSLESASGNHGVVSGDAVGCAATNGHFENADAGSDKDVSADVALTGADRSDYQLTSAAASTTASIDKAGSTTTVTCDAGPFVYNGSAHTPCSASVTGAGGLNESPSVDYSNNLDAGTATASASYPGDANHEGSNDSQSFTIDKRTVTASIVAADKTYDGTDDATIDSCSLESTSGNHGVVSPDDVGCSASNGHFDDANAGIGKAVTADVELSGAAKADYQLTSGTASTTADLDKADSTATVTCDAGPFVYNGSAHTPCSASVTGAGGLSQSVSVSYSDNIHAGTATASASFAGDGNHTGSNDSTTFAIDRRSVTASISAADKTYDGSDAATITGCSLETQAGNHGIVSPDAVGCSGSNGHFANKHAGASKSVSADVALSGDDKADYQLTSTSASTIAKIETADLDINAATDSKGYDGTTGSTAVPTVSGLQGTDTVTGKAQTFASKNVLGANGSTLVVTGFTVNDGNSGNNYHVHTHTAAGTITAAALHIYAVSDSKTYDGNTSSSGTPTVSGLKSGDTVTGKTQAFQSKDVLGTNGSTLVVTGYTVSDGNAGGNYGVTTHSATGTIAKKNLTVSGITASNKVFDGSSAATLNLGGAALVGVISPDAVTLNTGAAVGTFGSSAVGTWTVTVAGLTITGSDSGNYGLTQPTTMASILAWNANGRGFYAPVGADAGHSIFTPAPGITPTVKPSTMDWNSAKGGSTVPLKFNVFAGAVEKTTADAFPGANLAAAFNAAKLNVCTDTTSEDPIDFTTTGSTSLRYDGTAGQWIQNWKTPNVTGDSCYRAWVTFADGSTLEAFFKLKK
jgi:hypothetical protein